MQVNATTTGATRPIQVDGTSLRLLGSCEATISCEEWEDTPVAVRTSDREGDHDPFVGRSDRLVPAPSPGCIFARHDGEWYQTTIAAAAANLWAPADGAIRIFPTEAEVCDRVIEYWRSRDTAMPEVG